MPRRSILWSRAWPGPTSCRCPCPCPPCTTATPRSPDWASSSSSSATSAPCSPASPWTTTSGCPTYRPYIRGYSRLAWQPSSTRTTSRRDGGCRLRWIRARTETRATWDRSTSSARVAATRTTPIMDRPGITGTLLLLLLNFLFYDKMFRVFLDFDYNSVWSNELPFIATMDFYAPRVLKTWYLRKSRNSFQTDSWLKTVTMLPQCRVSRYSRMIVTFFFKEKNCHQKHLIASICTYSRRCQYYCRFIIICLLNSFSWFSGDFRISLFGLFILFCLAF